MWQELGMRWLQSRIEAAEKSRQTIVSECLNLEQQLSASESSRAALRVQFDQLIQEVEGYHQTIQQHVVLAASAKVRESHFRDLWSVFSFCFYVEFNCILFLLATGIVKFYLVYDLVWMNLFGILVIFTGYFLSKLCCR